jgi:L-gulonolactone oxidase
MDGEYPSGKVNDRIANTRRMTVPNYKTNHTFENWAHTLKFKPERFCQPTSEQEVEAVVKDTLARRGRVRTYGGGHSWSHFVVSDDTLIQLDRLDQPETHEPQKSRYTVQAGMRLKDLIRNLRTVARGIKNIGSITEQSIAGAISTGTHGTGLRLQNISASIVGLRLITGTGDVKTIKDTDTDLLNAARVSIGALGVITAVTIEYVPLYDLEYKAYWCKFADVIDKFDILNQENERFLVWWLAAPIGPKDNCIVVTMNPPGTPDGILGQAGTVAAGAADRDPLPMDTNDVMSIVMDCFPNKPFQQFLRHTGRYDQVLTLPLLPVLHRELEYALPLQNVSEALKSLRRIIEEADISTTLPIEVRFVAKDDSWLSPANGHDVCYIGVSTQSNANEVYARVEPLMKEFNGRPHWGKHLSLTREEVEEMYPDTYDKFRKLRKELDPHGVFANTLIRHLFD